MTNKHWWLKGLSVSLVLVMVGIVSWFYWQPERLIRSSRATTVAQVVRQRLSKKTPAVLLFYQPGCRDCRQIAPQVLRNEFKNYFSQTP
ncbi:thioredoxin [Lactiplantibacillus plantarum]|nr:thioredoxin [Lactiplantibacillus plantarum]